MIIQAVQCRAEQGGAEQGGELHGMADKQMKGDTCRGNLLTMPKRAALTFAFMEEAVGGGGLACSVGGEAP